jgi:hypothetical protein
LDLEVEQSDMANLYERAGLPGLGIGAPIHLQEALQHPGIDQTLDRVPSCRVGQINAQRLGERIASSRHSPAATADNIADR